MYVHNDTILPRGERRATRASPVCMYIYIYTYISLYIYIYIYISLSLYIYTQIINIMIILTTSCYY